MRPVERLVYVAARGVRRLQFGSYTTGSLVIYRVGDEVLLVRARGREHFSFPGGFSRRAERPLATAVREMAEETGVVLGTLVSHGYSFQNRGKHIDFVFSGWSDARPSVTLRRVEIAEAHWASWMDVPGLLDSDHLACWRLVVSSSSFARESDAERRTSAHEYGGSGNGMDR